MTTVNGGTTDRPYLNLTARPAHELARLIRTGRCSSQAIVDAHLARIDRLHPLLNAVVTRNDRRGARRPDGSAPRGAHYGEGRRCNGQPAHLFRTAVVRPASGPRRALCGHACCCRIARGGRHRDWKDQPSRQRVRPDQAESAGAPRTAHRLNATGHRGLPQTIDSPATPPSAVKYVVPVTEKTCTDRYVLIRAFVHPSFR